MNSVRLFGYRKIRVQPAALASLKSSSGLSSLM
jgi:hypothetical protein